MFSISCFISLFQGSLGFCFALIPVRDKQKEAREVPVPVSCVLWESSSRASNISFVNTHCIIDSLKKINRELVRSLQYHHHHHHLHHRRDVTKRIELELKSQSNEMSYDSARV